MWIILKSLHVGCVVSMLIRSLVCFSVEQGANCFAGVGERCGHDGITARAPSVDHVSPDLEASGEVFGFPHFPPVSDSREITGIFASSVHCVQERGKWKWPTNKANCALLQSKIILQLVVAQTQCFS